MAHGEDLSVIEADWPVPGSIRAFTTTRQGGVSRGRYAGLNVATHTGDVKEAVAHNRAALLTAMPGCRHLQWLKQVHGVRCVRATRKSCIAVPEADAAWTDETGLGLVIQTADCVPVVLAEASGGKIAALHGGWRGLVDGIVERTVEAMGGESLTAWVGPSIGAQAYEVGVDVFEAVAAIVDARQVMRETVAQGKWMLNLFEFTRLLLQMACVREVCISGVCTHTDERFYSYRRDGATGRMATVVWKSEG
ncbi:MAG: peptidoglycan editing factor PgeF [Pseudomonadales bacterium]|nr:peptidoglycan editing factor PgeF [Pseudomonadales bacterium]MDP6471589.1 peptidoglycan editing factor PgeF [Pseudomonadales bacterium]MDP6828852.1 peptidoglycan editing factor PgeF [Pseudomonadales bacterium]MDP6971706.1 peptidoglycan editing factor PgeF [Pseudomonadales bacterium]